MGKKKICTTISDADHDYCVKNKWRWCDVIAWAIVKRSDPANTDQERIKELENKVAKLVERLNNTQQKLYEVKDELKQLP